MTNPIAVALGGPGETKLSSPMAPGSYHITSGYGPRGSEFHRGIDYGAPLGTPIYAAASGTVVAAGAASGFGQWVIIDHQLSGKVSTVYGHMYPNGVHVHTGQPVKRGDHIADVGANGQATGPHLHFEVWPGGRLTGGHSVDPNTALGGAFAGGNVGDTTAGADVNVGTVTSYPWDFLTQGSTWIRILEFVVGVALVYMFMWKNMLGPSARLTAKIMTKGAA